MIERLLNFLRDGCSHQDAGRIWPITRVGSHQLAGDSGRQVCPICAMYRYYRVGVGPLSGWLRAQRLRRAA